jgi:hypothetical protein
MATLDDLRAIALSLPLTGEEAGPAFRVQGRHKFAVCRGEGVLLKLEFGYQEWLFDERGDVFSRVRVGHYDWAFASLADLEREELAQLVTKAWAREAPKRVAKAFLPAVEPL